MKESSGVVSAYMDAVSFAISGIFMALIVRPCLESTEMGWSGVWWILSIVALMMCCINCLFVKMVLVAMDEVEHSPY